MRASVSRKRYVWVLSFVAILTVVIVARVGRDAGPARAKAGLRPDGLPAEDVVNEALGLHASDVATLAFQGGHDGTFSVNVPIHGRSRTLSLAKHSVRSASYRVKVIFGEWPAGLVDGDSAEQSFSQVQFVVPLAGHVFEDTNTFASDFRPNAVAGNDKNIQFHGWISPLLEPAGQCLLAAGSREFPIVGKRAVGRPEAKKRSSNLECRLHPLIRVAQM